MAAATVCVRHFEFLIVRSSPRLVSAFWIFNSSVKLLWFPPWIHSGNIYKKFEVGHAASFGHLPVDGLLRPELAAHASSRESTWSTCFLLDVEWRLPASTAQGVRLVATFTKWAGYLSHSLLFWSGTGKDSSRLIMDYRNDNLQVLLYKTISFWGPFITRI